MKINTYIFVDENTDSLSRNKVSLEKSQDEKSEAIHLQQSKRSIFYQKAKKIFHSIKKPVDINQKSPKSLTKNPLYSPSLANYFLNNWTGLTPLWTVFLLVDPKFHEKSEVYTKHANKLNFKNIPRSQGLVELHHKVAKEITLNAISKRRVDTVIQSLYNDNIVEHRGRTLYKGKRKLQQSKSISLEENRHEPSPLDKSNKESLSSTAQNKIPSVENMSFETIDKEDSIISVEKHTYDSKNNSSKVEAKIGVESWRKREKRNYSYQVKPNLQGK